MDDIESHGFGGSPVLSEEGITFVQTESGFNTLTAVYIGSTSAPATFISSNWPIGTAFSGYPNMYIDGITAAQESGSVYKFTVTAKGLIGLQAVKRTISSRLQSYTTGPVTIPGGSAVSQAQGTYLKLSCTFNYVSLFLPSLDVEPQDAVIPPGTSLPSPPANPFASLPTTPIYNYPYGWCRQGIDVEQITGADVYLVREDYEYIYQYQPG